MLRQASSSLEGRSVRRSIAWDGGRRRRLRGLHSQRGAAAGAPEVPDAADDRDHRRFYHRLDSLQPSAVAVGYQRYPDQTHQMTALAFADGWRFMFERMSIRHIPFQDLPSTADSAAIAAALDASERTYAAAARELRMPEQLPEDMVNSFGYRLLARGKTWWALRLFTQNVERYPNSVNPYDSYGDGLIAAGDTAGAIDQFRRAVEVGRRTGAPVAAETREKLARFSAAKSHR